MGFADELFFSLAISGLLTGIPLGMIAHKAGRSWAIGLLAFIPLGYVVAFWMLAHGRWQTVPLRPAAGGR